MIENIERYYEELRELLTNIIPVKWSKIWCNFEIDKFERSAYYWFADSEANKIMSLGDLVDNNIINRAEYMKQFKKLVELGTRISRSTEQKSSLNWTGMTFVIDTSGEYSTDFTYDNLDDYDSSEREASWIHKHLKDYPEYIKSL